MRYLDEQDPRRMIWEQCESPIEQQLCCGVFSMLGCKAVAGTYGQSRRTELARLAGDEPAAFLFAQHWIGRYRADFIIVLINPIKRTSRHIVIECDGKAFHSSDEQIASDKERDAEIIKAGYTRIIRCTGTALRNEFLQQIERIGVFIEAFGVELKADEYAEILRRFNMSPSEDRRERQRLREQYWRECEQEENSQYFEYGEGMRGKWSDTL